MFELKRSEKIVEQIKLGDEIIEVNLDAGAIQARFTKGYNELLRAQSALNGATSDTLDAVSDKLEQYGNAVVGVLQVIFGEENTQKILAFYENNYTEMFTQIYPFIGEVIIPKISEASKRKADELKALYKGRKKWK